MYVPQFQIQMQDLNIIPRQHNEYHKRPCSTIHHTVNNFPINKRNHQLVHFNFLLHFFITKLLIYYHNLAIYLDELREIYIFPGRENQYELGDSKNINILETLIMR